MTSASLQLVDVQGRQIWSKTVQLDASGSATVSTDAIHVRGLLIARYLNAGFSQTRPVSLLEGAQ